MKFLTSWACQGRIYAMLKMPNVFSLDSNFNGYLFIPYLKISYAAF